MKHEPHSGLLSFALPQTCGSEPRELQSVATATAPRSAHTTEQSPRVLWRDKRHRLPFVYLAPLGAACMPYFRFYCPYINKQHSSGVNSVHGFPLPACIGSDLKHRHRSVFKDSLRSQNEPGGICIVIRQHSWSIKMPNTAAYY